MLGDESGVSFKQIQKYESGTNRIDAVRFTKFPLPWMRTSSGFSTAHRVPNRPTSPRMKLQPSPWTENAGIW
ncbi:MAG: hypothetical protein VX340_03555 [Pseudomonadota bacterium]|nr:hypothetical protein [Pseudomonadota bacterium]